MKYALGELLAEVYLDDDGVVKTEYNTELNR
jgi:hypothetical protein